MTREQKEDLFRAMQEAGEQLLGFHLCIDVTLQRCRDGEVYPVLRIIGFSGFGDHTIMKHYEPRHDLFAVTAAQAFEDALPTLADTIRKHIKTVKKQVKERA